MRAQMESLSAECENLDFATARAAGLQKNLAAWTQFLLNII